MDLSILYFKELPVKSSMKLCILYQNIVLILRRKVRTLMKCRIKTILLCAQNLCLIEKTTHIIIIFKKLHNFMSTSLQFKQLKIRNKTYDPENFKFTRFNFMTGVSAV